MGSERQQRKEKNKFVLIGIRQYFACESWTGSLAAKWLLYSAFVGLLHILLQKIQNLDLTRFTQAFKGVWKYNSESMWLTWDPFKMLKTAHGMHAVCTHILLNFLLFLERSHFRFSGKNWHVRGSLWLLCWEWIGERGSEADAGTPVGRLLQGAMRQTMAAWVRWQRWEVARPGCGLCGAFLMDCKWNEDRGRIHVYKILPLSDWMNECGSHQAFVWKTSVSNVNIYSKVVPVLFGVLKSFWNRWCWWLYNPSRRVCLAQRPALRLCAAIHLFPSCAAGFTADLQTCHASSDLTAFAPAV